MKNTLPALILQCPSDSTVRLFSNCKAASTAQPRSYSIVGSSTDRGKAADARIAGIYTIPQNSNGTYNYGAAWYAGRNLSELGNASEILLLVEHPGNQNIFANNTGATVGSPNAQTSQGCSAGPVDTIHFDGWNYLFADGHVKWLHPEATVGTGTLSSPGGMWTITEDD